ncbi:MAG TPA: hypothetical protein VE990_06755 [Acidimicrobiales bacterium]|nr:hypothetical protein [Acidimicrobiales bacterium]
MSNMAVSWKFSAGMAGGWLLIAALDMVADLNVATRLAAAFACLIAVVFAFQAGARLGHAGLSPKARKVVGVRSRYEL